MAYSLFPLTDTNVDGTSSVDTSTGRGKSPALWEGVPYSHALQDPRVGNYWRTDANTLADDQVTVTALNSATGAGFAKLAQRNGVRSLVATTGADHRGAQVFIPALGSFTVETDGLLVMECRVNLQRCSTFFVGLMEDGATVLDGSSVLPTNASYAGFQRINGGVVNFVTRDDDTGGDTTDSEQILASTYYHTTAAGEEEWTRLGFRVRGGDQGSVLVVVDGVPYKEDSLDINISSFPSGEALTFVLAAARGADQDESAVQLDLDYVEIFEKS